MRSRNIKPGFFKNELLAELPPTTRLFFIGLWCYADRDGRFEDRPAKIKMDVLPCDSFDAEAAMSDLCRRGFVLRYDVDGLAMAVVLNWGKHQNPHHTEKASVLPPYVHGCATVTSRLTHGEATVNPPSYNGEYPAGFTDSLIQPPPAPPVGGELSVSPDSRSGSLFPGGEESLSSGERAGKKKKGGVRAEEVDPWGWGEFAAIYPGFRLKPDRACKGWFRRNIRDRATLDRLLGSVRAWLRSEQWIGGVVPNCSKFCDEGIWLAEPGPPPRGSVQARQEDNRAAMAGAARILGFDKEVPNDAS